MPLHWQPSGAPAHTTIIAVVLLCAIGAAEAARSLQQVDPATYPGASPTDLATQAQVWLPKT